MGNQTNTRKSDQRKHATRNRKVLVGKPEALLEANIRAITKHCLKNINKREAVIVLASMSTGWTITDLLHKRPVQKSESGEVSLKSPWILTKPKLTSPSKELLRETDDVGLIPVPQSIANALYEALGDDLHDELTKSSVEAFLKTVSCEMRQPITLSRISKVIAYQRKRFKITHHMLCFLSGAPLDECSQGYYIAFRYEWLQEPLTRFWQWLFGDFLQVGEIQENRFFGSKRSLTPQGAKQLFDWHRYQVQEAISKKQRKQAFNACTLYVLDLLQFATLCRRVNAEFGSLESFASNFQYLFLKDKGNKSARIVPIPEAVRKVIQNYFCFLKQLKIDCEFIHKGVSAAIGQILGGKRPPFQLWMRKDELSPATDELIERLSSQSHYQLHRNWHRHTVLTALYGKKVCADKLRCFADHQPSLDHYFSKYSSSTFETLYDVSKHIEELIQEWNIPLLQMRWY